MRFNTAALATFCILSAASYGLSGEYFVAPYGNDQHPGTKEQPFATLVRARDEIRQKKDGRPTTVWIRGGTYFITQSLQFDAADSGTADAPIVYRAVEGEQPLLIGGMALSGWKPWQGSIQQCDIASLPGKPQVRQLMFAGQRQHLARYPNFDAGNPYGGGWAYADGKPIPMYQEVPGESKRSLHYKTTDARNWAHPEDVEVFVFPRYNWWNNIVRVASIDADQRIVTLTGDCSYPIRPGDRYYFQGAFEELDAPGEWYFDKRSGTVYFWPPESGDPLGQPGHEVFVTTVATILAADKVEHVTWRGLTLECADDAAISLKNCNDCEVTGCTIRNVSNYNGSAVSVNGGVRNRVAGCDISHVGRNGISLNGGDRKTLAAADHVAENNYIHHTGVFYKQGVGIALTGVGNRAAHNLIHDCPRFGIMFTGNNLVMEYNEIRHVNLETEDTGAVYTGGRDWISSRGTVIRHNYFHDILGYGKDASGQWVSPHFAWGVYLDDNAGGVDVIGNILVRCSRAGLHLHNGRDNLIENNIFVDNGQKQFEYSGWTQQHRFWTSHFDSMVKGYESVANEPAWKTMRNMSLHPREAVLPDGTIMSGNVFERNIVAWKNDTKMMELRNVSFTHNPFDHNLYYHFGRPVETGYRAAGKDVSPNLCPNGSFELGQVDKMPQDWNWQIFPTPQAKAGLVTTRPASGRKALRIDAAFNTEKPRDNYPIVVSCELELKLGATYRLRAQLRSTLPEAKASVMLQGYVPNAFFWASSPSNATVSNQWKPHEFLFRIPALGEKGIIRK